MACIIVYVILGFIKETKMKFRNNKKDFTETQDKGLGLGQLHQARKNWTQAHQLNKIIFVCERKALPHYLPGSNSQRIEIVAGVMIKMLIFFLFSIFELKKKHESNGQTI